MATSPDRKRAERLNVRLNVDLIERLKVLADDIGVAPTTLGAIAIGEYVNAKTMQREMLEKTVSATSVQAAETMQKMLSDPGFIGMIANIDDDQKRLDGV